MNEAFSDIVGAVVECITNDSIDRPDFDVGEMLGNKLRSMENPTEGARSIDSVCDYKSSLDVHHTSGPLNKAYVNAVRACQQNGCSDKAGCTVLIGTIFMYANMQLLTTYSGYLDGATATCSIVDEFFEAKSPATQCDEASIVAFIKHGWSTVNVALDGNCQSVECCTGGCPAINTGPQVPTPSPTSGPPTSPQPTPSPVADPTTPAPGSTPEPTVDPELEGEENIILRIFQFIFSLFAFFQDDKD